MVKLNLLETPVGQKIPEEPSAEKLKEEATAESTDFSFDSMETMFRPREEAKAAEVDLEKKEEIPVAEMERGAPSVPEEGDGGEKEFETFETTLPKKRLIFIGSIIVSIIVVATLLYVIFNSGGRVGEGRPQISAGAEESLQKPASATQAALQNLFMKNREENLFYLSLMSKMLEASTGNANYSLIISAPGKVDFSILAESREAIAQFHMRLKDLLPGLNFQVESIQREVVEGEGRLLADFSVDLTTRVRATPVSSEVLPATATREDIRSIFSAVSGKYGLGLKYFRQGYEERKKNFDKIYYYTEIFGKSQSIMKCLEDLGNRYADVKFVKISIYPFNLSTMGTDQVTARIILTLFVPL